MTLETFSDLRRKALSARKNSSAVHLADLDFDKVIITEMVEGRPNWRLCVTNDDDDVADEVVLRLQGILTKNNLVPKNVHKCSADKALTLSQHAEIRGERTSTFEEAMYKIEGIFERFEHHLPGFIVKGNRDCLKNGQNHFSASNRIFTVQNEAPTEQDNAFQKGVDVMNRLAKFKNGELIHAPENIVKYYKRTVTDGEDHLAKYEEAVPGNFDVGDIVEMQFCFVALAAGKNKIKLTTRLQALTLLDNQYSKEAKLARVKSTVRESMNPAVRRKVGYYYEDAEDERRVKKGRTASPE
ncbi:hypothetical protein C8R43DRAFT_957225 [Mycena crocata]|nr:hypothetical protein C8R43DRAFT_957225 [Mycena crocata]